MSAEITTNQEQLTNNLQEQIEKEITMSGIPTVEFQVC